MPRAGLTPAAVAEAGAALADEIGFGSLSMAEVAERLGVRAPALYKHVGSLADSQRTVGQVKDAARIDGESGNHVEE